MKYCTWFDIDIAGVIANVRAYVMDIPQSYSLLLGRRWLHQVRAVGNYDKHTYTIYDADGRPHLVDSGSTRPVENTPDVLLNLHKEKGTKTDLTEQERVEIMETIIAKVVAGAREQSQRWGEDLSESEDEGGDSSSEGDEGELQGKDARQ